MARLLKAGDTFFREENILIWVLRSKEGSVWLRIGLNTGETLLAVDSDAIEILYQVDPRALEGIKTPFPKFFWAVHNLIGHPVMQILSFVGLYKWAFWVHDATIPRPTLLRKKKCQKQKEGASPVAMNTGRQGRGTAEVVSLEQRRKNKPTSPNGV